MKIIRPISPVRIACFLVTIGFALFFQALASGETHTIDPSRSSIAFTVRLSGLPVSGLFSKFSGTVTVDPANRQKMTADAIIEASSISTNNAMRDRHLASVDYFDVERFPRIIFHSSKVALDRDGDFDLEGNLVIKGISKPVILHVHPMGKGAVLSWEAKTIINRKDFGVTHAAIADLTIADSVEIFLTVQVIQKIAID